MIFIKQYLYNLLEIKNPDHRISNWYERFMFLLIILNVLVTILETVKDINDSLGYYFKLFDIASIAIFTMEYLDRVWVCTIDDRYNSFILGRIKYMLTTYMILDLAVIAPFYLPLLFSIDTRFVLIFRMLRIARILKLTRYSQSMLRLIRVIKSKKDDLVAAIAIIFILLLVASSLIYFAEHQAQPDKFSSIPTAMWWAIVTLTTVGYGDLYPVTDLGKVIGGFIAILGLLMFAIPTGIIGSGFIEELNNEKPEIFCPHCGNSLNRTESDMSSIPNNFCLDDKNKISDITERSHQSNM